MPYIYSTITNGTIYSAYDTSTPGPARVIKKVEIKGGHGVAGVKNLITPSGVATKVTDEELEFLKSNPTFQRHVKEGWISYDEKYVAPEKKAKNMADKDGSAPLTPSDYIESENSTRENKIYTAKNKAPIL